MDSADPPIDASTDSPDTFFPGTEQAATPSRLWRLTWAQYDATASALLERTVAPSAGFDPELLSGAGYLNEQRFLEAGGNLAGQFGEAAKALARELAPTLAGCADSDRGCIEAQVSDTARRIWRRPASGDERVRYADLYLTVTGELGPSEGREAMLEAMLRSPYFLFRAEVGDATLPVAGDDLRLSPHEVASALSYALWNAPPDAELSALADSGALSDAGVRARQAERLLEDARAGDAIFDFLSQWLGFFAVESAEKDPATFPAWSAETGPAMLRETRAFVTDVLERGGGFEALMTAQHSFPGPELAWVYGADTDGRRRASSERMGLLMQPSFLAAHAKQVETSPTARGVFAVNRLACYTPPPPDPNIAANPPPPDRTLTTRQRFELHQSDPVCGSCHRLFDPIGLALESFDAVGRFRTDEHGIPLDLTGELPAGVMAREALSFMRATDVAEAAADSPIVHHCFVRNAFQYLYGREPETTDDPVLRGAMQAFLDRDLDPKALWLALVQDDAFTRRTPTP